ncbi:ribonuclease Y [Patescibacteria group bacterium]|nr:ribonuclease Y [Patescibacteria group bacterium]
MKELDLTYIILLVLAVPGGMALGYFVRKTMAAREIDSAEAKAKKILSDAKSQERELLLKAKDRSIALIEESKKEETQRRSELKDFQRRLEKRENLFDQKLMDLENRQQKVYDKARQVEDIKKKIQQIHGEQVKKLEEIASLSKDEAKQELLTATEKEMKEELVERIRKLERENQEVIDTKAKNLMTTAIQRCATSHAAETTTTTVSLPSDDMKGRIIGREGRNIKAIEQLTGVEIVVDDTPLAIVISGFSPIRRHLAKRALDKLIADGRIHPSKIEEAIEVSKKELAMDIRKAGEDAMYEVGITGLDPKLVRVLGRLKYRTSYGQNVLRHSVEVANLSALLAEELGANVSVAKKAGLLHDIGKAVDHEVQGTHPEIGRDIAKKFGLPEEIIKPIFEHHEDNPTSLEAIIVKVADAISGSRPGARKDTYEQYLQRLEELEKVASTFDGVKNTYAIQAGREIRVFIEPDKIDDLGAIKLAKEIAKRIEEELKYPGEIKVNVIRETRVVDFAR